MVIVNHWELKETKIHPLMNKIRTMKRGTRLEENNMFPSHFISLQTIADALSTSERDSSLMFRTSGYCTI